MTEEQEIERYIQEQFQLRLINDKEKTRISNAKYRKNHKKEILERDRIYRENRRSNVN